jgi:hypothetical protein
MNRMIALAIASTALLAACGSSTTSAPAPSPTVRSQEGPTVRGDVDSAHADCVALLERQRECSAEYVPALVDIRVRHDLPAGIAATDREVGRAALVAEAQEEWRGDSTDEAIAATCTRIVDGSEPATLDQYRAQAATCRSASDCASFVACIAPATEAWITAKR